MAFAERLLVDADSVDGGRLLAGEPAGDGSLEDVPGLIRGDTDERANSLQGLTSPEDVDHKSLHEQGKAAVRLRPRHLDLHHSVLRALDPWDTGMDQRVELAGG
jgi:hypothetical protein